MEYIIKDREEERLRYAQGDTMKTLLLRTLASLTIALLLSTTSAHAIWDDDKDGKPRNSYEQQQYTYQKHGYDTERHGPLPEAIREEQQRQEASEAQQRQREEERQRQERQDQQRTYKPYSGY